MTRVLLLPRISALGVSSILESIESGPITEAGHRAMLGRYSTVTSFAASGGSPSEDLAAEIGERIRGLARESDFPTHTSPVARSKCDHSAAAYLGGEPRISTGEALRDDVWAYITTIVVPDVVAWRFPDRAASRFEGGVRNALQRLWTRGVTLDRGLDHPDRWGLVRGLSEDGAVQIFERASVGGNPPLARALAEVWLKTASRIGRAPMEDAMRKATKVVRLKNEITDLAGLPKAELEGLIFAVFEQVLAAPRAG